MMSMISFSGIGHNLVQSSTKCTSVMNKYTIYTNEVGMEPFNLKVVDLNRLIQLLTTDSINKCVFAVLELQLVVQLQILCGNPALTLHIEGMFGRAGNGFAIDLNVNKLVLLVQEGADNTLKRTFASIRVFSSDRPRILLVELYKNSHIASKYPHPFNGWG